LSTFKILENTADITEGFTLLLYNAVNQLDGFGITDGSPLLLESSVVQRCIRGFRKRGKTVRYITDIQNENLESCKRIMENVELHHLDNIQGGIIINDVEYLSLLESKNDDNGSTPVHIYSKNKWLVEQQKLIFDMLWEKSIPAKTKIKQMEYGLEKDVCELITDEKNIMVKYRQALNSLTEELFIFYSVSDDGVTVEVIEQKISEIINHVSKSKSKEVKILAIILTGDSVKRRAPSREFSQICPDYDLRIKYMDKESAKSSLSRDLMILTIDRRELFISEIRSFDKMHKSVLESEISFTIHSNSKSVVSTYDNIFEMLWSRDELYKKSEMAITQLKLQDKLQQEFVHNFANGLRNPIQPILGFSEILLDKKDEFRKYSDILNIINSCAQKLTRHVNNMIDITELEKDTFYLNKETFDLLKLLKEIINRLGKNSFYINNKNFDLSTNFDSLPVYADRNRIKYTIENLISNAIDIPDSNNIKIFVEKTESNSSQNDDKTQSYVIVKIIDDGNGIDKMIFPTLFSKFVANSRDGLGLGLYLAKNIIEWHDGQIWAENNDNGKGATFRFALPIS
jgi:signal transduction histidine kinase